MCSEKLTEVFGIQLLRSRFTTLLKIKNFCKYKLVFVKDFAWTFSKVQHQLVFSMSLDNCFYMFWQKSGSLWKNRVLNVLLFLILWPTRLKSLPPALCWVKFKNTFCHRRSLSRLLIHILKHGHCLNILVTGYKEFHSTFQTSIVSKIFMSK